MAGSSYSFQQLEALWIQAGGPRYLAPIMAAIALAESSGKPRASHRNSNGSVDRGLWQINSSHGYGATSFNPLANARQAVGVWHSQGLGAWATYTNHSYVKYLGGGGSKVQRPGNIRVEPQADLTHESQTFLQDFYRLAQAFPGVTFDVFSGYRGPGTTGQRSAAVGGFSGDPHEKGVAADVYVLRGSRRVPIGQAFTQDVLAQFGLLSGNTPNFYQGKPDPTHIQVKSGGGGGGILGTIKGLPGDIGGVIAHDPLNPWNVITKGAGAIPGIGGVIPNPLGGVEKWVNSLVVRALLMLAGAFLVLVGLYLLARSLGAPIPKATTAIMVVPQARAARAATATKAAAAETTATRAAARETRAAESHTRRQEAHVASLEAKRRSKAEQEQAERSAYFRGATDAAHEQQAAAAAAQERKTAGRPSGTRKRKKGRRK